MAATIKKTAEDSRIMHVRIEFIDDILGTAPGDPDIHGSYISSKAPDAASKAEEIEALGEDEFREKGKTVFPIDEKGRPIFWNYQIKGFFKSACSAQRNLKGTLSSKCKAYKKKIDLGVFVFADASNKAEREIVIHGEYIDDCQRPLRAQTMQGDRVAIADSECIGAGAWCEFDVFCLDPADMDMVREWLDYGVLNGLGQWRNSGKGAFVWKELDRKPAGNDSIFK